MFAVVVVVVIVLLLLCVSQADAEKYATWQIDSNYVVGAAKCAAWHKKGSSACKCVNSWSVCVCVCVRVFEFAPVCVPVCLKLFMPAKNYMNTVHKYFCSS